MKKLIEEIKKSVVFLSVQQDANISDPKGTGFIVELDGVFHLVTAKHVVSGFENNVIALLNSKTGGIIGKQLFNNQRMKWIHHDKYDLSVYPFLIDQNVDDVKLIPSTLFSKDENLYELQEIFFASFDPGSVNVKQENSIEPVLRKGAISKISKTEKITIDATCYPGNSGSPVFTAPSLFTITDQSISIGNLSTPQLVGILVEYIPYIDVAESKQTKRPRITFEENSGLSRVVKAKYLLEIQQQQDFKEQVVKLKPITKQADNKDIPPVEQPSTATDIVK